MAPTGCDALGESGWAERPGAYAPALRTETVPATKAAQGIKNVGFVFYLAAGAAWVWACAS